ncbi:hypothetical protein HanRHA438_Chr06g0263201 [Helianthus annuus]|nr:hypothetical protein HanIR_Chr06g0273511 [Helianthus annuus]KAJ0911436.1 hypothetical protein HanRHA438_Chr06g0263201 [Helianthus annuus]
MEDCAELDWGLCGMEVVEGAGADEVGGGGVSDEGEDEEGGADEGQHDERGGDFTVGEEAWIHGFFLFYLI